MRKDVGRRRKRRGSSKKSRENENTGMRSTRKIIEKEREEVFKR